LAALAFDVVNQLVFFSSWPDAVRSWLITISVAGVIAIPVSRKIGKAQVALYRASTIDELTGVLNRRAFLDGVDDTNTLIALIIVDLDYFKLVNDKYGHWTGDQVLRAVADTMEQSLGKLGRVGRLGGEEFAFLARTRDQAVVLEALDAFRRAVSKLSIKTSTRPVSVTISAGMAMQQGDQPFEWLFARADHALYEAKVLGRNRIVLADDINPMPGATSDDGEEPSRRRQFRS
jgi:diguanylate cyclase (GGDEF)-like protein